MMLMPNTDAATMMPNFGLFQVTQCSRAAFDIVDADMMRRVRRHGQVWDACKLASVTAWVIGEGRAAGAL